MSTQVLPEPKQAEYHRTLRRTVLVIDDDEAMADVLSRRLEQQGFASKTADSGARGLAIARADRPDLILLDLRLPDKDGFTICEELADSSETCCIPVIILSGLESPDIIRRARAAGCHFFVRKPYDPNALLVLIRQAIDEANHWFEEDAEESSSDDLF
ncbi:MAG: response regulator [Pirellulaceae bacterium]|nr:response regulator [Pirellulaceae bacterium]